MIRFSFFLSFLLAFSTHAASIAPESFNFSGRLTDSTSAAVEDTVVDLTLQIFNPAGTCLLYEETATVDTSTTGGRFSIDVGSVVGASKRTGGGIDPGLSMTSIFRNGSMIIGSGGCSYTALPGDQRNLKVTITKIGSTTMSEVFASHLIRAVPYAMMAESAVDLQGMTPGDFAQINTSGTKVLTQSNLENIFDNTNYNKLTALLAGTSSLYSKPAANGTSVLPSIAGPASPAAGQVWYDGGSIKYYDGSATQVLSTGGTQTDITATGTITSATIVGTNGTITNFGTREIKVFDSDSSNWVALRTPTAVAADYTLILPPDDGTASQVLTTNGSGVLTWGTPTFGQIDKTTSSLADLTTRSAGDLSSGTLLDARLSSNVPLKNAANNFSVGGQQITNDAAASIPLVLKSAPSQTASLTNWVDSANAVVYSLAPGGVPTDATDLADKGYVDTSVGNYVSKSGSTMTGQLVVPANGIKVTAGALSGTATTGMIAVDSGASNALKWYDGSAWQTVGTSTGGVTSFNSRAGAVVPAANDYTFAQIDKTTSSLADLATRSAGDLSSGTLLDARLSSNVTLKDGANAFTGNNTFAGTTALNATTSATVATATSKAVVIKSSDDSNTNNIIEIQNSAGTVKASIRPDGIPTATTDLTTKTYVDGKISTDISAIPLSNYVLKNGDTMTGALVNNTNSASTALAVTQAGAGHAATFMGGKVGIGTTAPAYLLDITTAGTAVVQVKDTVGGTYSEFAATGSSGNSGSMGIRGPSAGTVGAIAANDVYLKTSTSNNIVLQTNAGNLKFSTANTERVRIDNTGNVGIGLTNPARLLQVAGPMRMTPSSAPASPAAGDMYIDSTGNALKYYDGAGWVTAGGGAATTDASLLTSGALADARLSSNVAMKNTANAFTDANTVTVATATKTALMLKSTDDNNTRNILEVQNNAGTIMASIRPDANPTATTDLTTKSYVDGKISTDIGAIPLSNYVLKAGDAMTGALVNNTNSASTALAVTQAGAGNAATFMGGNVGIGTTAPSAKFEVIDGSYSTRMNRAGRASIDFGVPVDNTWGARITTGTYGADSGNWFQIIMSPDAGPKQIFGADKDGTKVFFPNGNVGIGTTNPARILQVAGPMRMTPSIAPASPAAGDIYFDSTGNALKYYDGAAWVTAGGGGGSGIADLNGLTSSPQTLAIGTTGTAPNWFSSGSEHKLHIPMASTAFVTAGLISKTNYDSFNSKLSTATLTDLKSTISPTNPLFDTLICTSDQIWVWSAGTGSFICTDIDGLNADKITDGTLAAARLPAFTGDVTSPLGSNALTLATVATAGTHTKITFNSKGLVTAGSSPTTLAGYGITDAQPINTTVLKTGDTMTGALIFNASAQVGTPLVASVSSNHSSSQLSFVGTYHNGTSSLNDTWTVSNVVGTGPSPATTLNINHTGSAGPATMKVNANLDANQAFTTLTDGASINWGMSGLVNNAIVTLGAAGRTLVFSNLQSGMSGTIIVKQDATGGRTITALPTACGVNKVINGGAGVIVFSSAPNSVDILTFIYDGTACYWTYGGNYN